MLGPAARRARERAADAVWVKKRKRGEERKPREREEQGGGREKPLAAIWRLAPQADRPEKSGPRTASPRGGPSGEVRTTDSVSPRRTVRRSQDHGQRLPEADRPEKSGPRTASPRGGPSREETPHLSSTSPTHN
ncbi:hypothetical protein NHX12_023344 [Muraenolepis orangiensis]|uniref:Uncharacterized protein n=1 Tax=Muraenolepis orangiensis TaxID=630683 RepID=A0A9Q0IS20_9TELE|nr:hypothetical protein NHX12_023344 [Muraenolepis orangiensis]